MNDAEQWKMERDYPMPPGYPQDPGPKVRKRKRWLAGLLAFLLPGIGHMYLGLMVKGIVIMLLLAFNITGIVFVATEGHNVLSVVLLSLMIPIIYFYNLFDAMQSAEIVNERLEAGGAWPPRGWSSASQAEANMRSVPAASVLFLAAAGVVVVILADISWSNWLFNSSLSIVGAVVLIGAGIGLWFWEMKGQQGRKQ